jgi:ABC-2 type transport system ATP-binding protein
MDRVNGKTGERTRTIKRENRAESEKAKRAKREFALECTDVNKKIGMHQVLTDVNLSVKKGHIVGLLGPDGSGKSTLARIICSLTRRNSGEILVDGRPLKLKDISYLPEYPFVNAKQKVGDLVNMYKCFYNDFSESRALAALKRAEVSVNDKFCYLSRSSIQKVETILVMARKTKLYVLDEPIASVEPNSRDFIIKTIISGCDADSGVLITSGIATQIEKILDEVYIIHKGEIKISSDSEEIMRRYGKTVSGFYREAFRC